MYLLRMDAGYGIGLHLHQDCGGGMSAGNACTCDEMGVWGEILSGKHFIPCFDYTCIVHIYILYKKPGADAMVGQLTTVFFQMGYIVVQQHAGLMLRIGSLVAGSRHPKMPVCSVSRFIETIGQGSCLYSFLQISQKL